MGEEPAELQSPAADGFIADLDPALGHELLNIAKAQRETEIEPHGMSDDVDREPVASIRNGLLGLPLPARRADVEPPKSRLARQNGSKLALT